jgi:uncharacterized protein
MYWSAVVFGLLGSFHCAGMCGPIVLAIPGRSLLVKLSYNIGRSITYTMMGAMVGFVGEGFTFVGWQQILSIVAGTAMLLIIFFTKYQHFDLPMNGVVEKMWLVLKDKLTPLFRSQSQAAPFFIGLINGLLPCGMVYAALLTAISLGGIRETALYMFLFGLGTIPLLIMVSIFGNVLSPTLRIRYNKVVPYFLGLVAVLLILRGLNLGIPLISPNMDNPAKMEHMHSKLNETNDTILARAPLYSFSKFL